MNKLIAKFTVGLATAGIMVAVFAPSALAVNTVTVSGNGKGSVSAVNVKNKNTSAVSQGNSTAVLTFVLNGTNTGGNKIKGNTGAGNSTVTTGDVTNKTKVTVADSSNTADPIAPCGCDTDTTVNVTDNGKGSVNAVTVKNSSSTMVIQTNETLVGTAVVNLSNSGGNTVSGNTGAGDHTITSGNVKNTTTVDVSGGTNTL